jgi:hypothetical protein
MNKNLWAQLIGPQASQQPFTLLDPQAQLANDLNMHVPPPTAEQAANSSQTAQATRSVNYNPSYSQQFDNAFKATMDDRKAMLAKLQEKMKMEEANRPQGADALNLRPFLAFADQLNGTKAAQMYEAPTAPAEHKAKLAKLQEGIDKNSDKLSDDQLGYLKLKAMEEMSRNRLDASSIKGDSVEERTLRAQYLGSPIVKDFNDVDSAFRSINSNPGTTGPDQEAFVVQFNKLLDPGSVVREGEFFRSAANAGKINQMMQLVEKWKTGKGLTPEQVADMKRVAQEIEKSYRAKLMEHNKQFSGIAHRRGLDERNVVLYGNDVPPPTKALSFEEWKAKRK